MKTQKLLKFTACFFAVLLLWQTNAVAQIDQIRKKSDENRQEKSNSNNSNYSTPKQQENYNTYEEPTYTAPPPQTDYNYSSSDSYYESSGHRHSSGDQGCESCCLFLNGFLDGVNNQQKKILANEKKNGFATSLEVLPQIAYGHSGTLTLLPRIRVNHGLFSTDMRVTTLSEVLKESGATFSTWDWQILQLNLSPNSPVNVRMGSGLMLEKYSALLFNEHSFALDMYFHPKLYGSLEGRLAIDYETNAIPRQEASLRLHYSFIELSPFYVYVTAGAMLQNYYNAIDIWSAQSGFALVLR